MLSSKLTLRIMLTVLLLAALISQLQCNNKEISCDNSNVVRCQEDADCDDGVFCNGEEICDGCFCQAGAPPCPDVGDCVLCSEERDECASTCTADTDCDDGVFCNGEEICDGCFCQAGTPPCPDVGDCVLCSEERDECASTCTADTDCDDGVFCNGEEICDGCFCQAGTPPCPDDCVEGVGCP
ncbi:MAG: hypothetical protein FLDDKLPJ_01153 [Phycisphaerae bacterium]|nr:hypothetical protein [Phycisphaerae bacterium]